MDGRGDYALTRSKTCPSYHMVSLKTNPGNMSLGYDVTALCCWLRYETLVVISKTPRTKYRNYILFKIIVVESVHSLTSPD